MVEHTRTFLSLGRDGMKIGQDKFVLRLDGRIEWICDHGIGHPVWFADKADKAWGIHRCDGCCEDAPKSGWPKEWEEQALSDRRGECYEFMKQFGGI